MDLSSFDRRLLTTSWQAYGRPPISLLATRIGIRMTCSRTSTSGIVRTTASSKILEHFVPPYDATVVERLEAAGAVIIGKTNCDEFAMGSSNETSHFGPVHSPWRRKGSNTPLTPGGSSGGSAAAVAAQPRGTRSCEHPGHVNSPAAFAKSVQLRPSDAL
jgi:aspartyl-tRNA(Asn)/glutamyl-tRNA(Gln) amidotransferase subunit A